MTKHFLKFILTAVLLTAALIPFNYFLLEELFQKEFNLGYYLTYAYFLVVTIIVFRTLLKSLEDRPQRFVINFMAAMGGKLFLSLILLLTHMYFNKGEAKFFAVNFLILYLFYSFLGSYQILKISRKQKE